MDKSIIPVYIDYTYSRRGSCLIYVPAEYIDVKPSYIIRENYRTTVGAWFIRLYLSSRRSNKRQRRELSKRILMTRELNYYNEILKIGNSKLDQFVQSKIPFFTIKPIINEQRRILSSIIYGKSWK